MFRAKGKCASSMPSTRKKTLTKPVSQTTSQKALLRSNQATTTKTDSSSPVNFASTISTQSLKIRSKGLFIKAPSIKHADLSDTPLILSAALDADALAISDGWGAAILSNLKPAFFSIIGINRSFFLSKNITDMPVLPVQTKKQVKTERENFHTLHLDCIWC